MLVTSDKKPDRPITGWEVFRLPEFQALCDRLGIAWRLPTRKLVIEIPAWPEDVVKINHEYLTGGEKHLPVGVPNGGPVDVVDTTTSNNERLRTGVPTAGGLAPTERERTPPFDDMENTSLNYVPRAEPVDTTITPDMVPLDVQLRWEKKVRDRLIREGRDPGRLVAAGSAGHADAEDWQGSEGPL